MRGRGGREMIGWIIAFRKSNKNHSTVGLAIFGQARKETPYILKKWF
jgi:hypothetical protein